MLRTITVGSCMSVQGNFVTQLEDGQIVVAVGNVLYRGRPVVPRIKRAA